MKKISLNKYLLIASFALVAGILYSTLFSTKKNSGLDANSTAKVERGELLQRSTMAGTVTPFRKTIITAPYQGYVKKIFVKLGQSVKSGDPIASVAPTLVASDTVYPLQAPFDGLVVQLNKSEGEFIKASDASDFIARIDDLSRIYVETNVPELDRVKIKIGLDAIVKASAIINRTYKATIKELTLAARDEDRRGRSTAVEFPMKLEVLDFDEELRPGMSVIIDIVTLKKENVLKLKHEYIGKEKDTYFVTLQNGKRMNVQLGVQNEEYAEIIEGVTEGDIVQKVDFSETNKD